MGRGRSKRNRRRKILSKAKPASQSERVEYLGFNWTLSIPKNRKLNILDLMIHPRCKVLKR